MLARLLSAVESIDFTGLIDALKGIVTPQQILDILVKIVTVAGPFVLLWFGLRKLVSMFNSAFRSGRIKV